MYLNWKEVKHRMKILGLRHVDVYTKMGVSRSLFELTIYKQRPVTLKFLAALEKALESEKLTIDQIPKKYHWMVENNKSKKS